MSVRDKSLSSPATPTTIEGPMQWPPRRPTPEVVLEIAFAEGLAIGIAEPAVLVADLRDAAGRKLAEWAWGAHQVEVLLSEIAAGTKHPLVCIALDYLEAVKVVEATDPDQAAAMREPIRPGYFRFLMTDKDGIKLGVWRKPKGDSGHRGRSKKPRRRP
jgi:hypothetical protein